MNLRSIAAVAALTLAFSACTDGGASIFYVIEHEQPVVDSNLPNDVTSLSIRMAAGNYYTNGGTFRVSNGTGTGTGIVWTNIALPSAINDPFVNLMTGDGTNLALMISDTKDSTRAVYAYLTAGSTWAALDAAEYGNESVYNLLQDGTRMYLQTYSGDFADITYDSYTEFSGGRAFHLWELTISGSAISAARVTGLYDTAGASVFTNASFDGLYNPILSLATVGAETWLLTGDRLLHDSSSPGITEDGLPAVSNSSSYPRFLRQIHNSPVFGVFLTNYGVADNAGVYRWNTGTSSWDSVSTGLYQTNGFCDADFTYDDGTTPVTTQVLLLGSVSGYYEYTSADPQFRLAGSDSEVTIPTEDDLNTYENSRDLSSSNFNGFFADATNLFGLTSGNGLWHNENGEWQSY